MWKGKKNPIRPVWLRNNPFGEAYPLRRLVGGDPRGCQAEKLFDLRVVQGLEEIQLRQLPLAG